MDKKPEETLLERHTRYNSSIESIIDAYFTKNNCEKYSFKHYTILTCKYKIYVTYMSSYNKQKAIRKELKKLNVSQLFFIYKDVKDVILSKKDKFINNYKL